MTGNAKLLTDLAKLSNKLESWERQFIRTMAMQKDVEDLHPRDQKSLNDLYQKYFPEGMPP